ncbi:MAG: hypothetical protein IJ252_14010 [Solobacterium sp.]|nr:hypothetical protein [Solobacterium sp.]
MARDLLGTWSLDAPLPEPSDVKEAVRIAEEKADDEEFTWSKGEPVFVDIDTDEYRRRLNTKAVKKTARSPPGSMTGRKKQASIFQECCRMR